MTKNWLIAILIVAITLIVIVCVPTYLCHQLDKTYIENGYTRVMLPGSAYAKWALP